MESVLLVCETQQSADFFQDFLSREFCSDIRVTYNGEEAKRALIERDYDVCIINSPIKKNELSEELAIGIAEKNICQVILVVKEEFLYEVEEKVEDFGVLTLSRPIQKSVLWSILKLADVSQRRIAMIRKENAKLNLKLKDIKLESRAKCLLVSYFGMTEESAHKYIEKQAMDLRLSKREVSQNIIKTYEY